MSKYVKFFILIVLTIVCVWLVQPSLSYASNKIDVESITLNKSSGKMGVGRSLQLKATILPVKATNKTITWKSSNTKVATVSNSGKVTAKALGTATITATTANKKTATFKVTVKDANWNNPDYATVTVAKGKTVKLGMTLKELKAVLGEPTRTGDYPYSDVKCYTWKDDKLDYYVLAYISSTTNKCYDLFCSGVKMTSSFGVSYGMKKTEADKLKGQNLAEIGYVITTLVSDKYGDNEVITINLFNEKLRDKQSKLYSTKWAESKDIQLEFNLQAVDAANLYRKKAGLAFLEYKEGARALAEFRTSQCIQYKGYLGHDYKGVKMSDKYKELGYNSDGSLNGSDIATTSNLTNPYVLVSVWMASKGHRPTIMYDFEKDEDKWYAIGISTCKYGSYIVPTYMPGSFDFLE